MVTPPLQGVAAFGHIAPPVRPLCAARARWLPGVHRVRARSGMRSVGEARGARAGTEQAGVVGPTHAAKRSQQRVTCPRVASPRSSCAFGTRHEQVVVYAKTPSQQRGNRALLCFPSEYTEYVFCVNAAGAMPPAHVQTRPPAHTQHTLPAPARTCTRHRLTPSASRGRNQAASGMQWGLGRRPSGLNRLPRAARSRVLPWTWLPKCLCLSQHTAVGQLIPCTAHSPRLLSPKP